MAKRRTLLEDERLGPKYELDMYIYNNFPHNYNEHWPVRQFTWNVSHLFDDCSNSFAAETDAIGSEVISTRVFACGATREIL